MKRFSDHSTPDVKTDRSQAEEKQTGGPEESRTDRQAGREGRPRPVKVGSNHANTTVGHLLNMQDGRGIKISKGALCVEA